MKSIVPAHYDLDLKLVEKDIVKFNGQINTRISQLEEKIAGWIKLSKGTSPAKKEILKAKIAKAEQLIKSLKELDNLFVKLMESIKLVCAQQGQGGSQGNFTKTLEEFVTHLSKMGAFSMDSQLKPCDKTTVFWSKIIENYAKTLLRPGEKTLESTLAGFLLDTVGKLGFMGWSNDVNSPLKAVWERISVQFAKEIKAGSEVKSIVFPQIVPGTIFEAKESIELLEDIKKSKIESIKLFKAAFLSNGNKSIFCVEGPLPTDLSKYNDSYIFDVKGKDVTLYYVKNDQLQPLKIEIDKQSEQSFIQHGIKDFSLLIKNLARQDKALENDSPSLKIKTMVGAKAGDPIYLVNQIPTDIGVKYNNSFFIVRDSSKESNSDQGLQMFLVKDGTLVKQAIKNPLQFNELLLEVQATKKNIQDKKPSLYKLMQTLVSKNPGHERYFRLDIPKKPIEIKTHEEMSPHVRGMSGEEAKQQGKWYFRQQVKKSFDKVLPELKNLGIFNAVRVKSPEAVKDLFKNNPLLDVNARNSQGWTPLLIAIVEGNAEMVKMLISLGANVNQALNFGSTPLMLAAEKGFPDIVKILLSANANVHATNKSNKSALDLAEIHNHVEIHHIINLVVSGKEKQPSKQADQDIKPSAESSSMLGYLGNMGYSVLKTAGSVLAGTLYTEKDVQDKTNIKQLSDDHQVLGKHSENSQTLLSAGSAIRKRTNNPTGGEPAIILKK